MKKTIVKPVRLPESTLGVNSQKRFELLKLISESNGSMVGSLKSCHAHFKPSIEQTVSLASQIKIVFETIEKPLVQPNKNELERLHGACMAAFNRTRDSVSDFIGHSPLANAARELIVTALNRRVGNILSTIQTIILSGEAKPQFVDEIPGLIESLKAFGQKIEKLSELSESNISEHCELQFQEPETAQLAKQKSA